MTKHGDDWEKRLHGEPLRSGGFSPELKNKVRERIRMKAARYKLTTRLVSSVLAAAILCSGWLLRGEIKLLFINDEPVIAKAVIDRSLDEQGDIVLKVQKFTTDNFMTNVGKAFIARHPGVELNIVEPSGKVQAGVFRMPTYEDYVMWLEQEQPDVVIVPYHYYVPLAQGGYLQPLDTQINQDKSVLNHYHKPVLDVMRAAADGAVYGLATEFSTQALYINKKLFEQYQIPLPTDGMSWEEVLQTAQKFAGLEGDVTGLAFSDPASPYSLVQSMAKTQGLRSFSEDGSSITVDSPSWRQLWEDVIIGIQDGWINYSGPGNQEQSSSQGGDGREQLILQDPFAMGHVAMRLDSGEYRGRLNYGAAQHDLELEWMTVTEPVDPAHPDRSSEYELKSIYAVRNGTLHPEAAWEVVRLAVRPQTTSWERSSTMYAPLSVQTTTISLNEGHNAAFYRLSPDPGKLTAENNQSVSAEQLSRTASIRNAEIAQGNLIMKSVLQGERSLEEGLAMLQGELELAAERGEVEQ
ncbi:extracellular solute-binding protein [Paenibacillaceae bacterium]|nr:extracellular solute-binding protein [Paenibacillaceae bacterium]